jgi:hypothetical protein
MSTTAHPARNASARPSGHCCCGSADHHAGPGDMVNCVPASAISTCWLGVSPYHAMPLSRNSPASAAGRGWTPRAAWKHTGWNGRFARKTKLEMPYSIVSGVCSCSRASTNQRGCCAAASIVKRRVPSRAAGVSTACWVESISAAALTLRTKALTAPSCASVTRSHLLIRTRLANSICRAEERRRRSRQSEVGHRQEDGSVMWAVVPGPQGGGRRCARRLRPPANRDRRACRSCRAARRARQRRRR